MSLYLLAAFSYDRGNAGGMQMAVFRLMIGSRRDNANNNDTETYTVKQRKHWCL
jgi:hypothetical protein